MGFGRDVSRWYARAGQWWGKAKLTAAAEPSTAAPATPEMPALAPVPAHPYAQWIAENEPGADDLYRQTQWSQALNRPVRFSIVTPLYQTPIDLLEAAARSVGDQTYGHWQWCLALADDESRALRRTVERLATIDPRIILARMPTNQGIATATNTALARCNGDYVVFLDHDDELAPFALYEVARRLSSEPQLDLVYSDEDYLAADGSYRYGLTAKPDWSPETFLGHNYLCHLVAIRRDLIEQVGGVREGYNGAQDWDLLFRVTERTGAVGHIAKCLYHWRAVPTSCASGLAAKPYAQEAQRRVVTDHFRRRGIEATVETLPNAMQHVTWEPPSWPLVSIVIPTRDQAELLEECLDGLLYGTAYPHLEVVLVDNGSSEPATAALYRRLESEQRVRRIDFDQPFNFSAACNAGAAATRGEVLVFLNNDTEVLHDDWLAELVRWALVPEIGIVGPKLLFPSGKIQHAGMALGMHALCGHLFYEQSDDVLTGYGGPNSYRNVTMVTGACQAMRREVFTRLGGFDERYEIAYSDCALCLAALGAGYRNLYTPYARLMHHECATRDASCPPHDARLFAELIARLGLRHDPYLSSHLDISESLALPRLYARPNADQVLVHALENTLHPEGGSDPANFALEIFRRRPELRAYFPWAFLPHRRDGFADWLAKHAHREYGAIAPEALPELRRTIREDLGTNLAECYLHNADWQREYPLALTAFDDGAGLNLLRDERVRLPGGARPTSRLTPLDQLRRLAQTAPGVARLLHEATEHEPARRQLLAWARGPARQRYELSPDWLAQLERQVREGELQRPGVNLIGHLASHAGLGEAGRGLLRALREAEVTVAPRNVAHPWGIDGRLSHGYYSLDVHDIDLYVLQPEGMATQLPYAGVHYREANYRIGMWTWELEHVPDYWLPVLDQVDEVWVPSRFVAEAVRKATDLPVVRVPYCVELGEVEPFDRGELGLRADDYVFLFMFDNSSVMARKNPLAVVEAFKRAFALDDRAALVLKVGRSDYDGCSFADLRRATSNHNIRLWTAPLSRGRTYGLIDACDCYVSLHRSEGFGLTLAEAMLLGKPVIGTAWSGNMDFMTNENSLPVAYDLVDVPAGLPFYESGNRWAEASMAQASDQMRWAFEHRSAARQIGEVARQQVGSWLSSATVGRIMRQRLAEIAALSDRPARRQHQSTTTNT
ncbi:MAG: glycosyltransferase [Pirellulales bacterium]|nr:glycosyltransferase [Pirellulales bacterium]